MLSNGSRGVLFCLLLGSMDTEMHISVYSTVFHVAVCVCVCVRVCVSGRAGDMHLHGYNLLAFVIIMFGLFPVQRR